MLSEIMRRLRMLLNGSRAERELDEEMRLHVELRAARLAERGLPPDAAAEAARRRFGNLLRLREDGMDAWGWRWIEQFRQDLRFGLRTLSKNPGFAATAIVTLALATGATTAIFSVVNGVLLRPLPFRDPEQLVQLFGRSWSEDRGAVPDPMTGPIGSLQFEEYEKSASFEALAGYSVTTSLMRGQSGLERLNAVMADLDIFSLLGVDAIAGRTFRADDSLDVAVISERLWRERFGSDPLVAGKVVTLDDRPSTIVGVMPGRFQFPFRAASLMAGAAAESRTDLWVPLVPLRASGELRRGRVSVVGRMKPGVTREAANAELSVISSRVEEFYRQRPETRDMRVAVRLEPLSDVVVGRVRRSLWMLFAAVGLVLAAACANVANLLLARMSVRSREVVTRAALGAGRLRLVRQFIAESAILSLAGGLLGIAVARWGMDLLMKAGAARMPRAHEVALDWQAFAFLLLACLATAVLFGLAPALTAARMDVRGITHESGRATMGRGYRIVRDALVIVEVALAFVLAIGAALVIREVARLQRVETGMNVDNALTLHVTPRAPASTYYAIEERVSQLPGVRAAGFTQMIPLQNWGWEAMFAIEGRSDHANRLKAELRYVTPGYFRALGIPLMRGRLLNASDTAESPKVILVNEAFASQYLRNEDPVGIELVERGTIVGVVGDVRQVGLDRPASPEIYYPAAQNVTMATDIGMSLVIRTTAAPETQIDAIRATVRETAPDLAIFNVRTMSQVLDDSLWQLNLYRWLIGLFAMLALILATIGLYGVISYMASARTREFAIRLALGSEHGALAGLVVTRGLWLSIAGVVCGAFVAYLLTRYLSALSISTGPDVVTFAATSAIVLALAIGACAVPAFRAATVDPISALRQD